MADALLTSSVTPSSQEMWGVPVSRQPLEESAMEFQMDVTSVSISANFSRMEDLLFQTELMVRNDMQSVIEQIQEAYFSRPT